MAHSSFDPCCGGAEHYSRRTLLKAAGLSGLSWLTPLGNLLAANAEAAPSGKPAQSVILLWMAGAPSQLETFDPHPGSPIAYGTEAISTSAKGIQIASSLEQTAEIMNEVSLIRSVVSEEGDHDRAIYNIKTGYRLNPALTHPSIGAVVAHELPSPGIEIPTHISILPNRFPGRGGHLGAEFDAFQVGDPVNPLPDMKAHASGKRQEERMQSLNVVEDAFSLGRIANLDEAKTQHLTMIRNAQRMMTSDQLAAFDVSDEPAAVQAAYGDSPFGRGCLAARRLIEAGVRCVEVTLDGWDTHINNHELQAGRARVLDPAFATLIRDLKDRKLLDHTVVVCAGEFGRTPTLNALEGRDHWPTGFSVALAGGGIAKGRVIGATDPTGKKEMPDKPVMVKNIHATIQTALGIDPSYEVMTPANRPLPLSEGRVIKELLESA